MISPTLRALIQSVVDHSDDAGCSDDLIVTSKEAIAALAGYVEPMSQEDFADNGGCECPFCRCEDVEYDGRVRLNGDKAYHDCKCDDCGKAWIEIYSLTGYEG
jgi:hypothetical protein